MRDSLKTVPFLFIILLFYPCVSISADFESLSPFTTEKLLNTPAPDFAISDNTALSSFRGSVVLLLFWSDRCPTCLADAASLTKLRSITDPAALKIVAVHTGRTASTKNRAAYTGALLNVDDSSLEISIGKYSITSLPTALLIDKNGMVTNIYRGQQHWTDSRRIQKIERLMQQTK